MPKLITRQLLSTERGYLLIFAIVFMAIMMTLSVGVIGYARVNLLAVQQTDGRQQALHLAEAGIDKAIYELNQNANYLGEANTSLGLGSFTISVSTIDQYTKRITVTGYAPYGRGLTAERTIEATASIDATIVSFAYGVQAGNGGFDMANNSVVNGNVFSNGNITGSGSITGDATVAAGAAAVADQEWTTQNVDFLFGNSNQRTAAAQSFIPSVNNTLTKASVYLKKIGSPGDLVIQVVTDNNGVPSKTVVTNGTVLASQITGSYAFIDGSFNEAPTLTGGQKYWLMLVANSDNNNYYSWGSDQNSTAGKYSDDWNAKNPVWANSSGKFDYKVYMGGVETSLSGVTVGGNAQAMVLADCDITGDAHYEVSNSCAVGGVATGNTPAPAPQAMPISAAQITAWESDATAGGVIAGDYEVNGTVTLGPKKISGDLVVDNSGRLYLTGPVWVDGNITINNNSTIAVDASLGNSGAVLIADYITSSTQKGIITISNNSVVRGNGEAGSHPLIISMFSGAADAIELNNNATSSIFYAPNGIIHVNNNAALKEITAYRITLNNNASVNYDSGLQSTRFSNGPGGSWTYLRGSYAITR